MTEYISPMINSLSQLVKSDGYTALQDLYDGMEQILLSELHNAVDDRALTIIQGKCKMLKKLRHLPEETIDRYLNETKGKNDQTGRD